MKKVDIIVPVYNAYEYTEECIKSLIKFTDLINNRVILINDQSPDQNILSMLKKYETENIIILNNENNLGFVKTVNRGMKYSDENDVVLLNSDTEVTKNWLQKMQKCAYSNKFIGTVTPFTNNGTICSIPNFCMDNDLPQNMSLDEYANLVEECSEKEYPQISTANGFCMYIKRETLNLVGFFDEESFEKGYGEENDFCYRALNYGFTNNLCDDTFIYHKGSQSFSKENLTTTRAQVIEEHMNILKSKHPVYYQKNDNFVLSNPLKKYQEKIKLNIELHNKKRVLFIVNEWEENMQMFGGTSLHVKDLIMGMKKNTACFVLAPDKENKNKIKLFIYTENVNKELFTFVTDIQNYNVLSITNQSYIEVVEQIIKTFKIDILHVHHLIFQTFDIIDIAKKYNIYSIITLHDLYMLCPTVNMINNEKYCGGEYTENCKKCFEKNYFGNYDGLNTWRKICEQTLKKFDEIIVPSENTREIFKKYYQDLEIQVIEHGVDIKKYKNIRNYNKKKIDIAFVGVMANHKGLSVLEKLIEETKNKDINIHLIGKLPDEYNKKFKHKSNFINHGVYNRGELAKKIQEYNIDLVCIFAAWPETYSYTLTEVYMSETPVLCYDIGAVGDRIKNDKLGWTIDCSSSIEDIIKKIKEIQFNKEEYEIVKNNFKNYKFKTTQEMQEEYLKKYDKVSQNNTIVDLKQLNILNSKNIEMQLINYETKYKFLINRFEKIRKAKIWKIAKKIKSKLK